MISNFFCDGELAFLGLFDLSYAPSFLLYSSIPSSFLSLLIASFVLYKDNFSLRSKLLFGLAISFSLWLFTNILVWVTVPANLNYFGWQILVLFQLLIPVFATYFALVFVKGGKDINFIQKLFFFIIISLTTLLIPSTLNMHGFDVYLCEALVGPLTLAVHIVNLICSALLILLLFTHIVDYLNEKSSLLIKKQNIIVLLGTSIFLLLYSFGIFLGEETKIYVIEFIGPFGMVALMTILMYTIVRFKTFNIKLAAPIALVFGLWALVFALLFVKEIATTRIIVAITLLLLVIFGLALIRSIKREIKQREQIEGLVVDLNKANERLKILDKMKSEFVSIASHQLRSPLTSIRGYASMLAEGSYGKLAPKAQEIIQNIADSSMFMAQSVEDYLNVSRIEAGNMKYEMSDFNLKDVTEKIVDEMRSVAMKKGLVLIFRSDCTSGCITHADIGKTRQVIMNLLDNSMKYTPKGTITVVAHDDIKSKKMYITLQDTGVGMSKETQEEVFDKFVRAKNANNINVTGTGLGLFVAKKMIEEMGGRVWAESEGEGKGSTFHIELPLASGI